MDSTFEFEKRRNRPIKYQRDVMEKTLLAMKRVNEIQRKRQEMFYKMRMKAHKVTQRENIKAEIRKGIELLAPAASDREKVLERIKSKDTIKQFQKKTTEEHTGSL